MQRAPGCGQKKRFKNFITTVVLQKFYAVFYHIVLILRGLDILTTEETVCSVQITP